MTAIDTQVENPNFLAPQNFKFVVKRMPGVTWFAQELIIPSISLPSVTQNNPFTKIPHAGDHIQYDPFQVSFRVDEDMVNYMEIQNWMRGLGFPESMEQYAELKDKPEWTGEGLRSELVVHVLKSNKLTNLEVKFHHAYPISLSDISFSSKDAEVMYPEATATFDYTYYTIERVRA